MIQIRNLFLLIVFLFCINSCKKEKNGIQEFVQGKIKSEMIIEMSGVIHTIYYEYKSNGKMFKYSDVFNNTSYTEEFNQNGNEINIKYFENGILKNQHNSNTNDNGYIISETRADGVNYVPFLYNYNSDGFLIDLYENWQNSEDTNTYYHTKFEIQNSNIQKQFHPSGIIFSYEYYDNYLNKGIYQIKSRDMAGLTLYPGYYGKHNNNLLKFKIATYSNDTLKYEYIFDSYGRVKNEKCRLGNSIIQEKEYSYY